LQYFYSEILSTLERLFSIAKENQIAENVSIRVFATEQFDNSIIFDFSISDNKYCIFCFVFVLTFFSIFLLQSNCVITIVNTILFSVTLENRSFLIQFKKIYNIFIHSLSAQIYFEYFRQNNKFSITIQDLLIQQQYLQTKLTNVL